MLELAAMATATAKDQEVQQNGACKSQADDNRSQNRKGVGIYGPIQRVGPLLIRIVDIDGMLLIERLS